EFLEAQLKVNDSLVADAQDALTAFQRRARSDGSGQTSGREQTELPGLELQRQQLLAERRTDETLLKALQDSSTSRRAIQTALSTPGVAPSPAVVQLNTQLFQYEIARDSLASLSPSHPDLPRLNLLISSTEAKLLRAVQAGVQGAIASLDGRIAAINDLRARRAGNLQHVAQEARLTERVENARKVADELRTEYQKAGIAEAVTVGQIEIVDHATLPMKPAGIGLAQQRTRGRGPCRGGGHEPGEWRWEVVCQLEPGAGVRLCEPSHVVGRCRPPAGRAAPRAAAASGAGLDGPARRRCFPGAGAESYLASVPRLSCQRVSPRRCAGAAGLRADGGLHDQAAVELRRDRGGHPTARRGRRCVRAGFAGGKPAPGPATGKDRPGVSRSQDRPPASVVDAGAGRGSQRCAGRVRVSRLQLLHGRLRVHGGAALPAARRRHEAGETARHSAPMSANLSRSWARRTPASFVPRR